MTSFCNRYFVRFTISANFFRFDYSSTFLIPVVKCDILTFLFTPNLRGLTTKHSTKKFRFTSRRQNRAYANFFFFYFYSFVWFFALLNFLRCLSKDKLDTRTLGLLLNFLIKNILDILVSLRVEKDSHRQKNV